MMLLALSGILVLTIGGCVCVWWAARGGPRWTRAVSAATLATGELARRAGRYDRNPTGQDN
ncbi:hypothetical protein [Streptomyces griseorubiginosus]|uniref:hypothetical protein n=1 Tax=Streptomyces griseorubiginosus TaxID=67304 RepID=UPI002E8089AC|nr:hypothetical protein [Streptomyces griseorubiginosus]WUB45738.1 hypothetical protein OHN19_21235 [Streptomyces griseorubiginosus]WUB54257.1 hypothetical protein OG942_21235 [Streptomyces griseorubiginosus]